MNNSKKAHTNHYKIGSISLLAYYYCDGFGWFRIFGIGLHCKDTSRHEMNFPERNRYRKYLRIGSWIISFLPK